jgi:hypothetical protein
MNKQKALSNSWYLCISLKRILETVSTKVSPQQTELPTDLAIDQSFRDNNVAFSSPRRIPQPSLLKHKLEYSPALCRIDITQLAHVLLLQFPILLHRFAENLRFDRDVRFGLQAQFNTQVALVGEQKLPVGSVVTVHVHGRDGRDRLQ